MVDIRRQRRLQHNFLDVCRDHRHGHGPGQRNVLVQVALELAGAHAQALMSSSAREVMARFFAICFSVDLQRPTSPSGFFTDTGGNSPKLTFMGWKLRGPGSPSAARWPPVMCSMSAPIAVVGAGASSVSPRAFAAAMRPAISPMAALST